MCRYYCSGFDTQNAFGHGLGDMFKSELKATDSIVYIPGGFDKIEKVKSKYIPAFTEHFKNVGITFKKINLITPEISKEDAKSMINNASFIMIMGGDPFKQKELCEKLDILNDLKRYNGVMLGFSAGAMLMSKYIIITPCSDEYPEFHVEKGLDLDGISIYPHNNTILEEYPDTLVVGDETYQKSDLIKVAKTYGDFYLLQDNETMNGDFDVSVIKSKDGIIDYYRECNGKIWVVSSNKVTYLKDKKILK